MKKIIIVILFILLLNFPFLCKSKEFDSQKKYVALSFDDGPSKYTKEIVNYLNDNNCNATFFIIGEKISLYKDILLDIINSGNEIGNHTYTHPWLTQLTDEKIINEINNTQNELELLINYKPKLFRPSYGDINDKLRSLINLKTVLWTNDSSDWKYKSYKTIASNVIRQIKENDIILLHDTYKRSYDALKIIIPKLKSMGYEIVTVSDLLEIRELKKVYEF